MEKKGRICKRKVCFEKSSRNMFQKILDFHSVLIFVTFTISATPLLISYGSEMSYFSVSTCPVSISSTSISEEWMQLLSVVQTSSRCSFDIVFSPSTV